MRNLRFDCENYEYAFITFELDEADIKMLGSKTAQPGVEYWVEAYITTLSDDIFKDNLQEINDVFRAESIREFANLMCNPADLLVADSGNAILVGRVRDSLLKEELLNQDGTSLEDYYIMFTFGWLGMYNNDLNVDIDDFDFKKLLEMIVER